MGVGCWSAQRGLLRCRPRPWGLLLVIVLATGALYRLLQPPPEPRAQPLTPAPTPPLVSPAQPSPPSAAVGGGFSPWSKMTSETTWTLPAWAQQDTGSAAALADQCDPPGRCKHGGTCNRDGDCVCKIGFVGSDCSFYYFAQKAFKLQISAMVMQKAGMQCTEAPASSRRIKYRNPVMLIPPMEGAWIESKFGPAMKQPDPTCRRSRSYWKQFWLPTMMLFMGDDAACWAAGASLDYDVSSHGYAYPTGSEYRVNMTVESMCLPIGIDGKSQRSGGRAAFCAYECICERLEAMGYEKRKDLLAMPFDWRLGPQNWFASPESVMGHPPLWGYFSLLQKAIEEARDAAVARGQPDGRVMLLGFSLSGPLLRLFLAEYVTAEWKKTYVAGFFSLSGVFRGSLTTLPNIISTGGQNFHVGVPRETQAGFRDMFRSWGSLLWMVALRQGITGASQPIVKVQGGRSYSISELGKLLQDAGVPLAAASLKDMQAKDLVNGSASPGVDTWILHGSGQDTPTSFTFPALESGEGDWDAAPVNTEYAMGDNTAPFDDLVVLPKAWQAQAEASGGHRVFIHHLVGVPHDKTVRSKQALAILEAALRNLSNQHS